MKCFTIENNGLRFTFDVNNGLKCKSLVQLETKKEWLYNECSPFIIEVDDELYSAEEMQLTKAEILEDGKDQVLVFELFLEEQQLRVRLSIALKQERLVFLVQAGANWSTEPKEVYLHIPIFKHMRKDVEWHLSENPKPKPDGSAALEVHEEFPLPICCIEKQTGDGIMLEFPDYPEFTGTWNQNRNRVLLKMTDRKEFLNHKLLLRLQNKEFTDVLEVHFSSVTNGYKEVFFRYKEHVRANMDFSMYEKEDLKWYGKALYHHLAFAYSKEIFNYETQKFEIERLLDEGEKFGGYDILVLWFVYPRLGVDARKQWDFSHDISGGFEGINEICQKAHRRGTRVMLPYNPWDRDNDESNEDTLNHIAELVEKTEIDGIWFDTMDSVPEGCKERIENIRPGVVCCLEVTPRVKETVEHITGSWNQRFAMPEGHVLRYLFPEHVAPMTSRWRVGKKKDQLIKRAIFNGTGFAIWQDVFGAWLPFSEEQKSDLKKWKEILLKNYDTYFGKDSMPLYPGIKDELYINAFYNNNGKEEIYSVYNASSENISGELFFINPELKNGEEVKLEELWMGEERNFSHKEGIVSGNIEPEKIYIFKITRRIT